MRTLGPPKLLKYPYTLNGLYLGKVVDNTDTTNSGRVRVYVYGVHQDESDPNLPWAVQMASLVGTRTLGVPDTDQYVWVFFIRSDPDQPAYLARPPEAAEMAANEMFGFAVADGDEEVKIAVDRKNKEIIIGSVGGYMIKLGSEDLDALVKARVKAAVNTHKHRVIGVKTGAGSKITSSPTSTLVGSDGTTEEVQAG